MSACANHPHLETAAGCGNCGQPYCEACLVEFAGGRFCGPCREFRLAQMQGAGPAAPPSAVDRLIPARNPTALVGYYVGVASLIPCVGLLAGPAAVVLGIMGLRGRAELPGTARQGPRNHRHHPRRHHEPCELGSHPVWGRLARPANGAIAGRDAFHTPTHPHTHTPTHPHTIHQP